MEAHGGFSPPTKGIMKGTQNLCKADFVKPFKHPSLATTQCAKPGQTNPKRDDLYHTSALRFSEGLPASQGSNKILNLILLWRDTICSEAAALQDRLQKGPVRSSRLFLTGTKQAPPGSPFAGLGRMPASEPCICPQQRGFRPTASEPAGSI